MFWFLLLVFAVVLGFFLYGAFWNKGRTAVEWTLGLLDGLIGWSIKHVVSYLFPSAPSDKGSDDTLS